MEKTNHFPSLESCHCSEPGQLQGTGQRIQEQNLCKLQTGAHYSAIPACQEDVPWSTAAVLPHLSLSS